VIILTLGTGVGGAVMVNGKLVHGQAYRAGEIGHIYLADPANHDLPKCGLGHHGCLEAFIKSPDLDQAIYYLGIGVANLIDIFNPHLVVLSGGMMIQLGPRVHEVQEIAEQYAMAALSENVQVVPAALGDHAGVIGAAMLAMLSSQRQ